MRGKGKRERERSPEGKAKERSAIDQNLFSLVSVHPLMIRVVQKFIIRDDGRSISALVCTRFVFIPTIYLSRLSSTLIEVRARARAILRAIDEASEKRLLLIVLRESKGPWEGLTHRASNFAR